MKIKHPLQIVLNEETVTLGEITNSPGDILTINESGSISRRTTSEILADTSADTRYMVVVSHGSTASTARPAGATAVYWVGSVAPENAESQDIWIDTANQGHLEDFSDVTITDISTGEILVWDGDEWVNNTLSEAGIASASHNHDDVYYTETEVDTLLSGKASSSHSHDISDVTGLQTALDGKADDIHSHDIADVTGLQAALDGKAASSHVHDASAITTGTLDNARLPSEISGKSFTTLQYLTTGATEPTNTKLDIKRSSVNESGPVGHSVAKFELSVNQTVTAAPYYNVINATMRATPSDGITINSPDGNHSVMSSSLIFNGAGTLSAVANIATGGNLYGSGTIGSWLGIRIRPPRQTGENVTSTIDTAYGLYIQDLIGTPGITQGRAIWQVGTNDINYLSGKTGIGNNNPSEILDVYGNIAVSGTVDGVDISAFKSTFDNHDHNDIYYTESEVDTLLSGKASVSHSHAIADVTGLQTALDGKAATSHTHDAGDVTSGTFAIARIPTGATSSTVALGNHNHTLDSLSNVTITANSDGEVLRWNGSAWVNNTLAEAGIAAASHDHDNVYYTETEIDALLEGYAELEHTHAASDITSGTFDIARLPTGTTSSTVSLGNHNHTLDSLSNVTITSNSSNEILQWNGSAWINRTLSEAGIAASSHTHSASDITSGTLNIARIPTGSTSSTVSLGNHSHTLDSLSNVTITSNTAGEILQWNGSAWINRTLEEAGITGGGEHDHDDRYYTKTESEALFIQVVEHGSTANTERPADATVVYWYGSVEPENKAPGDIWFDSDADPLDFAYQNQNNTFSGDNLFSGDNDFVGGFTLVDFLDISDSILMYGRTSIIGYNTAETDDYTLMRVNSSDELLIGNTDGFPLVLRSTVDPTVVVSSNDPETVLHTGNHEEVIVVCLSDETSDLETGDDVVRFRMPFAMEITEVRASVSDAPTGSVITIDIKEDNSTIFSTKLTIDASEKTSTTAATPYVLSDTTLADDAEISFDIDTVGSTNPGKGLKVTLKGYQI